MDSSPSGSPDHRYFQVRILEWVVSRGPFQPRDQTHVACIGRPVLYHWATWEALNKVLPCLNCPILWHKHFTNMGVTTVMNGNFHYPQLLMSTEHLSLSSLDGSLQKSWIGSSLTHMPWWLFRWILKSFPELSLYSCLWFVSCDLSWISAQPPSPGISTRLCPRPLQCRDMKTVLGRWAGILLGPTSFVSCLSEIVVLHCLMSRILKTTFLCFVYFLIVSGRRVYPVPASPYWVKAEVPRY